MSNCGSFTPKSVALVKSTHCFHCDDTPMPAIEREEDGHADADPARVPAGRLLVSGDQLVLGSRRPVLRGQPIGDHEVHEHDGEEHDREHQRRGDLGGEEAAPGAPLPERVEPQEVGVEAGETPQAEQQDDEDDDERDDPTAKAEAAPGHLGRDAHRSAAYPAVPAARVRGASAV